MAPSLRCAAVVALALGMAACGNGGGTANPRSTTNSPSVAVMTPNGVGAAGSTSAARLEIVSAADVSLLVNRLGLTCSDAQSALLCNRGGDKWTFRVSPQDDGDAAFRRAACDVDENYNSAGMITDGRDLVVYAGNDGQNLEGFRDQLTAAGAGNLRIERGC